MHIILQDRQSVTRDPLNASPFIINLLLHLLPLRGITTEHQIIQINRRISHINLIRLNPATNQATTTTTCNTATIMIMKDTFCRKQVRLGDEVD